MNYNLIKDVLDLIATYQQESSSISIANIEGFKKWIVTNYSYQTQDNEPYWEGKENGRSPESVINTLIVHMNRYAKSYSKSAIYGSDFSTQEDFIYLITLKAFGAMSKMDLIKKNVHEKPTGMQIINRLTSQGWVDQIASKQDKRSKILHINDKGIQVLDKQMDKIRQATQIVTGDLTKPEKLELIRLLNKLNDYHLPIYEKNIEPEDLLNKVLKDR